ncbi:non-ribosomal peptide synthetase, partial [Corallococcus llansteffanensis]
MLDLLAERTEQRPHAPLFTLVGDEEGEQEIMDRATLQRRAQGIAAVLQQQAAPGERAVLLYPPGLEYVAGFFGCMAAGLVAVPAYPPDPLRLERTLPRLQAIIQDAQATVVLTTSFIASMAETLCESAPELRALRWVATDALPEGVEDGWRSPALREDSLAFLQYTSGSTGTPKGVELTHGNLLHNLRLIHGAFRMREDSAGVIWLPPYHDMGLIGGILGTLHGGFATTLMSPLTFLRRPMRWLETLSRTGGTISGGPNFAFDLCVRKSTPEQREALDLSRWEVAFCGAEPIRPETLDRFAEAFAPAGFRREALYACYGLAEGTLIVSGAAAGTPPVVQALDVDRLLEGRAVPAEPGQAETRSLVGCGRALEDQDLIVVNTGTLRPCAPGEVGEVWVKGPSVARGYWNHPEESQRVFQARTATGEGPFLRTGDLGFLRADQELFVTGRLKDLIIIRGRNHHPQDIELTAEQASPALRPGCGAAFSVEVDGEERLSIVYEVDRRRQEHLPIEDVARAVAQHVAEHHELQLHTLTLIEPGSLPKTSSGKIQRRASRSALQAGELPVVSTWSARSGAGSAAATQSPLPEEAAPAAATLEALEDWLHARLARRFQVAPERLERSEPLTRHGLDSLGAVELSHDVERALGVALPMEVLLSGPSVRELAARLHESRAQQAAPSLPPLVPATSREEQALSFAQQRLWFLDQLAPGEAHYHIAAAVRLEGPVDTAALERVFTEVVRRHESLRTTFRSDAGKPVQVLHPDARLELSQRDLSGLSAADWEAGVQDRASQEARRPFDLTRGPLLRATLLRRSDTEHVLVLVIHHIVSDGGSMGVLVREVSALYSAFVEGRPALLAPLPVQYADYARWQREWLRGEVLEAQLAYWRRQLAGVPQALDLPTDRPRPPMQGLRGAAVPVRLSRERWDALKALARDEGVTPFMLLLAAFQVLLHRYSGQEDFCVGTPIAGRPRPELEGLIGFFVNTLVLRARVERPLSFRELLGRVRQATLEAYANQHVPFERLVEELRPERDTSRSPLFQVMLALLPDPLSDAALAGVSLRALELEDHTSRFDLELSLTESAQGLSGTLGYSTSLFEPGTVARMVGHLDVLLGEILARPGQPIGELSLLPPAERQQVLVDFNATAARFPREACVHHLFEQQVSLRPEAIAIEFGEQRFTYGELERRAGALARRLRTLGVGPEVVVGLHAERSLELVVGMLAILKAGGAYVPLDPAYPEERLAWMLENSGAPVVLTQRHLKVPGVSRPVQEVLLEDLAVAEPRVEEAPSGAGPDTLAYVLYTSGSTGRPKGVMVPHQSVANFFHAMDARVGAQPAGTWLAVTSVSFDISVLELLWTLARGFKVVLPEGSQAEALHPASLAGLVRRHAVTHLQCTPSLAAALVLEPQSRQALSGLRRLLVGGEALPVPLAAQLARAVPEGAVLNMYGPTETTVWSSSHRVEAQEGPVPIGTPIANTSLYVLDERLQPVPLGVPGELYIGGLGVVRGYLARPELTAERFLPDSFSHRPGARMYRTGDLTRWRMNGTMEFLGRADFQVKVRGFRIELGEVEAVLGQHPGLQQAVVVAREVAPGDRRLVAYVVPRTGQSVDVESLRQQARARLPEYMVPSLFVTLEALPLTPNRKVDRKALPAPTGARPELQRTFVAPATATEERLAQLWAEVLGVQQVGAEDGFFELGGHSLLATQVVARVRAHFGVELPLRSLFEAPTVRAIAARLEAALQAGGATEVPPPMRADRSGPLPLSFAQQRLWFLEQLEPGQATYHLPVALRLSGDLRVDVLERCFTEVVRRHESLRTTFGSEDGHPVQRIQPPAPLPLEVVDLTALPLGQREEEAWHLAQREATRPFSLARGPLLRTSLVKLGEQDHLLLLTMHHIVSDGWSMGVLVREMAALYPALCEGRASPLPELPVQYADYAVWHREWLRRPELTEQLAWWRQQLEGAPGVLELPTDHARPAWQSHRGARLPFRLSRAQTEAARELALHEGGTLFMTLLTTFQTLLFRLSGQDDVSVGTPIAGRSRPEVEGLIGLFINTLVLRTRVRADTSFRALLAQVREVALGAYQHPDVPFEKLVEELRPERNRSHAPLFQVMFILQPRERSTPPVLPGVRVTRQAVEAGTAMFDLTLTLSETDQGLEGAFEYSTDLFTAPTVERWAARFTTLLEAACADPDQLLSRLPVLPDPERRQLLVEWNTTGSDFPADCLHHPFDALAARTPDAVALIFGDVQLTYGELEQRAEALARRLRTLGVGPEVVVGLHAERSLELVVGMLAILKAGGAYVPLDPAYPEERLAWMLENSGAPVVLTQRHLKVPGVSRPVQAVLLEDLAVAEPRAAEASSGAGPDTLAYVLYTSGSTGRPKGVMVPHQSVANFFHAMDARVGAQPVGTWLAVTSVSFDISVLELLWTLARGFKVVLPEGSQAEALHPASLAGLVRRHAVTHLQCTPSLAAALVLEPQSRQALSGLRRLLVGGEALPVPLAAQLARAVPEGAVLNMYGPTETTVWSSSHRVEAQEGPVPIGTPIANTSLYVLDERLQPVPLGVPGELYIGGLGVVRGYLARPELTAERFLPDSFSHRPGARMYRTGDLTRWRMNGTMEFLGRADFQVKVRGFRIELGEVEAVLGQHPGLQQAVVVAREVAPGDRRLVAYVVPRAGQSVDVESLRQQARARLPEYMVPSLFVTLEALPLTPNRKVDRKALPAPTGARPELQRTFVAPATATEERLAQLWAEVLGVQQVGAEDGFFELGGHSLLATQVVARVRAHFGVELPLRSLFEAPTVRAIAARLEAALQTGGTTEIPPPMRADRSGPLPLSFAQQRLWFLEQLEPGSSTYHIHTPLRLQGPLDVAALQRCFTEVVRRHESLRTTFAVIDGQPLQRIQPAAPLPLEVVDLTALPMGQREEEAQRLSREDAARPFSLEKGPLLRTSLVKLGEQDHLLLLTMHHIVSDGWSMGVLVREMSALFAAHAQGKPSPLPELPVQYADYAVWQRDWLRGEVLERQLSYWKQQLAGAPQVLEFPTDRPYPAVPSHRGAILPVRLPRALSEQLKLLAQQEGATPFMLLLAAFQSLLHRYSGQDDLLVGSAIVGRRYAELEGLIGFFVNTLVLRARMEDAPSFRALLRQVKGTTLGAYAHQDIPFEKLVEELKPRRDLGRSPLVQVMFVQQNAPVMEAGLPGISLRPVEAETQGARFDLTLNLGDAPEGFTGTLVYSTDLFEPATAARMMAHLQVLLEGALASPDAPLASLPLLRQDERHQLLVQWNDTASAFQGDDCLHHLFEAQVLRTPDAPAVVFEGACLSFHQLNARSNQLAWHLRSLGVGPDVPVGLYLERSVDSLVAILAVLKAGGAYVPLDPAYPPRRLAFMLQDCQAPVLLSHSHLDTSWLPSGPRLLALDASFPASL